MGVHAAAAVAVTRGPVTLEAHLGPADLVISNSEHSPSLDTRAVKASLFFDSTTGHPVLCPHLYSAPAVAPLPLALLLADDGHP